jgi:hypothetical protein
MCNRVTEILINIFTDTGHSMKIYPLLLTLALLGIGCQLSQSQSATAPNPAAPGFNQAASDAQAIAIADEVMEAMGGRPAWDDTRYLRWTFFGQRHLIWDRAQQRVRIDVPGDSLVYLFDYHDQPSARAYRAGVALTEPDSVLKYTEQARRIWINDSYWLVMPFKLKDSGVTLRYLGEGQTELGEACDRIELTFEQVGVTPQNKYHIWVDQAEHLVRQWAYFAEASEDEPRFTLPWLDYQTYGQILLSGDRGPRDLTDIAAPATLSDDVFTKQ